MPHTHQASKTLVRNLEVREECTASAAFALKIVFVFAAAAFLVSAATAAPAQKAERANAPSTAFARLYNFCSVAKCSDGTSPDGPIQGLDGNFYGTTYDGGIYDSACSTYGCGTIYKITPSGVLTTIYHFCSLSNCADGTFPVALILGNDGNFYGVTRGGGATNNDNCMSGCGTLFRLTSQGKLTTLYSFEVMDSIAPDQVLWGSGETLYGATDGGLFQQQFGEAFIFNAQGTAKFFGGDQAINQVWFQGPDGLIYGTVTPTCDQYCTVQGGWLFTMSADGTITTGYDFCPAESNCTYFAPGPLIQAVDGNLYGTIGGGTPNSLCVTYGGCGAVYQVNTAGAFTPIYNFCQLAKCADGEGPYGLVAGSDGNIYGEAGPNAGMIFELTPGGTASSVYTFCSLSGCGESPSGLVQATDGSFYGTTSAGGSHAKGTLYHLATGLPAFVHPLVTYGAVGSKVRILGSYLKGTTAVFFNGTPAVFEVGSNTNLTATVPTGATTGVITVTTSKGTLSSNVLFGVQ